MYIKHHGIKGQRWGIRRFQNKDGSLIRSNSEKYWEDESKTIQQNKDGSKTIR